MKKKNLKSKNLKEPVCLILSGKINFKNNEKLLMKRFIFHNDINGNKFLNQFPNRFF